LIVGLADGRPNAVLFHGSARSDSNAQVKLAIDFSIPTIYQSIRLQVESLRCNEKTSLEVAS